ncbi:MAG: hypothetical protein H0Z28_10145 [Archaeoglobus sp.]|nr:hypothetical protein [Archaeoglobus sp.]
MVLKLKAKNARGYIEINLTQSYMDFKGEIVYIDPHWFCRCGRVRKVQLIRERVRVFCDCGLEKFYCIKEEN